MHHVDQDPYRKYCEPAMLKRSVNMLIGILYGISSDESASKSEIDLLEDWINLHEPYRTYHPFSDFFPVIKEMLADGVIDESEKEDILWVAQKIIGGELESAAKTDIQILHGLLQGIIADDAITSQELSALQKWIADHEHLKRTWPYDEIESIVCATLSDGVITSEEQSTLLAFLSDFCELKPASKGGEIQHAVSGVCALCPDIVFDGSTFCFTGSSSKKTRKEFEKIVKDLGGVPQPRVTKDLHYLVIGDLGNPCWAFACYGRKVEQAMKLRKEGAILTIVHENDFLDAVADLT